MEKIQIHPASVLKATAYADARLLLGILHREFVLMEAALHAQESEIREFPYDFELHGFRWQVQLDHLSDGSGPDDPLCANVNVVCMERIAEKTTTP